MATLMPLCAGLFGPKSENVEKTMGLKGTLERVNGDLRELTVGTT